MAIVGGSDWLRLKREVRGKVLGRLREWQLGFRKLLPPVVGLWWVYGLYIWSGWWFHTFLISIIYDNIWVFILPIDELTVFKVVIAPPTRYGYCTYNIYFSRPRGAPVRILRTGF